MKQEIAKPSWTSPNLEQLRMVDTAGKSMSFGEFILNSMLMSPFNMQS